MNLAEIRRKAQAAAARFAPELVRQAQPVAVQVAAEQTAVALPVSEQPVSEQPVSEQPVSEQPVSEVVSEQVVPAQPAAAAAPPAQPAAVQPVAVQPAPVQPAPVPFAPVQPAVSQPLPEPPQWQPPADWEPPAAPVLPDPPRLAREPELRAAEPEPWEQALQEQVPAGLSEWEEATGFDPAAVILQGRQSAAGLEAVREADQVEASLELLCFRVATEDYAIDIMDIKEIIKPREVTEVPRVPAFVRGILSLRGIIIPVFDMRLRLGLPEGVHSERERIVVVKRQGGFCGVLVDQVVQVVRIAEAKLEAPPVVLEGIDREFIQGIGRVAGRMLILLDMEKVLDIGLL
jgi:purine-binding chemotaxis protein CheW